MICIFLIFALCQYISGTPILGNGTLHKLFEGQDKVCTVNYNEDEANYKHLLETITGLDPGVLLRGYTSNHYTGFKVQRIHNLSVFKLRFESALRFTFCSKGKRQWQIDKPLGDDFNWSMPLCVYIPSAVNVTKVPKYNLWSNDVSALVDLASSYKKEVMNDLDNFHCFKMARRSKYTTRSFSIFFPGTWIGGLFYYDLSDNAKLNLISKMDNNLQFSNLLDFEDIDQFNVTLPVLPILSDDYSRSWVEVNSKILPSKFGKMPFLEVTKYVPFMNTPNLTPQVLDFNLNEFKNGTTFARTAWNKPLREQIRQFVTNGKLLNRSGDQWFNEVNSNENYQMGQEDIQRLQSLSEKTIKTLEKLNLKSSSLMKNYMSHDSKSFSYFLARKLEKKISANLATLDKYLAIISANRNRFKNIELEWRKIKI